MTRSKYAVSVAQLEHHAALHPDAYMLFMKIQEEQTDTITGIMAQLSLKSGFKSWGTKDYNAVNSEMKQFDI